MIDTEALRRGDPSAADSLYRAHAKTVLRWVIRLAGPGIDPEDIAHDVFGVALRRTGSLVPGSPVEPWLFGVTRRVVANARRRAKFRRWVGLDEAPPPIDVGPSADARLDQLRRRRLVQEVLEVLTTDHREVLVLVDLEGRSAPEVSAMLQISVGTVYSRVHHARKRFGEALAAHHTALELSELRSALAGEER
ncbi:MAG: RNA polymerase sigma factor [Myxococcota bacterium]